MIHKNKIGLYSVYMRKSFQYSTSTFLKEKRICIVFLNSFSYTCLYRFKIWRKISQRVNILTQFELKIESLPQSPVTIFHLRFSLLH